MREFIPILMKSQMFSHLSREETESMVSCMGARVRYFDRGEFVLRRGEEVNDIYVLVKGKLHIIHDDYWGNRSILGELEPGNMFAEAYAAPQSGPILNDVIALSDSAVISFRLDKLIGSCSNACVFHTKVIENLFFAISERNRRLVQKIGHISRRSTREKLLSYLSEQAERWGSAEFTIPFDRQQLADFLSVDRSAMSSELGRMRDEGLVRFRKNRFELLLPEDNQ